MRSLGLAVTDGEEGSPVFALGRLLNHEAVCSMRLSRERVCLLFSGGKDSIVLLRLAEKAFRPARFRSSPMHVTL